MVYHTLTPSNLHLKMSSVLLHFKWGPRRTIEERLRPKCYRTDICSVRRVSDVKPTLLKCFLSEFAFSYRGQIIIPHLTLVSTSVQAASKRSPLAGAPSEDFLLRL